MTPTALIEVFGSVESSQSAFVRGFIDDTPIMRLRLASKHESQSAFVRGFIDDPVWRSPRF